jgi:hypothetical protein
VARNKFSEGICVLEEVPPNKLLSAVELVAGKLKLLFSAKFPSGFI